MSPDVADTPTTPQPRHPLASVKRARVVCWQHYDCFIGVSPHVAALKDFVARQAARPQPALLVGERGLRQEQIARALHQASADWEQPFISLNAHGLTSEALYQMLFGPQGVVARGGRGTIFVNELAEMPPFLQQRLAVHLEEQSWRTGRGQAGGVRLVLATASPAAVNPGNRLAHALIEQFRSSAFHLKPLRERSEDIPYLVERLLERLARRLGRGLVSLSPTALRILTEFPWEQNMDELEATLESTLASLPPQQIGDEQLPARIRTHRLRQLPEGGVDLQQVVEDFEQSVVEAALRQTGGHQTRAAQILGLRVQTLNMKLKRFAERKRRRE
jgi:DNA-binding NtrC family response regulator